MTPSFETLRAGRSDCPSDLALDRLHARQPDGENGPLIEKHIASCEVCTGRMSERRAGFDALDVDPRRLLARIRAGADDPARDGIGDRIMGWLKRAFAPMAAVAAVGAVVIVVQSRGHTDSLSAPDTVGLKGSLSLHVFRFVGDRSEEAVTGDRFAAGDRIRFSVDLPVEGLITIVGEESSGELYTAWPLDPRMPTRYGAGTGIELPGAVSLDGSAGKETLYLVQCPVGVGAPKCISGGVGSKPICQDQCAQTSFMLEKAP